MYSIVEEQGVYQISYPLLSLENLEIRERKIELKAVKGGTVVEGPYKTVNEAISQAISTFLDLTNSVEKILDDLELRLETDRGVNPVEIYDAVYLAHTLHLHALSLREFVWRLRGAGLIGQRPVEMARFALRRAEALRRSSLDLRLLHLTQVQYSINLSMKRLTLIGTLALPALLITSIYGMNLSHLP